LELETSLIILADVHKEEEEDNVTSSSQQHLGNQPLVGRNLKNSFFDPTAPKPFVSKKQKGPKFKKKIT